MKIELQYPYNQDWDTGYIQTNRENRQHVYLYKFENDQQIRSTTSYARYWMSCFLKRYLTEDEEVDHIDDDKTNDSFWNLQVLSSYENRIKDNKRRKGLLYTRTSCAICGVTLEKRKATSKYNKDGRYDYCGKVCGAKFRSVPTDYVQEYQDFYLKK